MHRPCESATARHRLSVLTYSFAVSQLAIATHPMARTPPQKVRCTVAGAAPTATLIKHIELLGIEIDHIYGMTETVSRSSSLDLLSSALTVRYPSRSSAP